MTKPICIITILYIIEIHNLEIVKNGRHEIEFTSPTMSLATKYHSRLILLGKGS